MSNWKSNAEILGDVVFFNYTKADRNLSFEEIFVWDLDKTYLDTRWTSSKDLIRTFAERAFQKRNVPGTSSLLQALKTSWVQAHNTDYFPVYFVTASPPQLENKIIEKLKFDNILPLGIFFKDNLKNIHPKRWWRLTNQVGYKLQALLQLRCDLAENVKQVFWGDDSESDVVIYNLYSDICSRRLDDEEIRHILKQLHVGGEQTENILSLRNKTPKQDPVEKIYINLATDTDPDYYLKFGRRTVPTDNTFQTAVDLFQDHRLQAEQVLHVAQDMRRNYGFTNEEIEKSFDALVRRQVLSRPCAEELLPRLQKDNFLPTDYKHSIKPLEIAKQEGEVIVQLEGTFEPWIPDHIDYLHDYR